MERAKRKLEGSEGFMAARRLRRKAAEGNQTRRAREFLKVRMQLSMHGACLILHHAHRRQLSKGPYQLDLL